MKKNILFIVVDSVTNNQLFNSSSSILKAPFLNSLRNKSISGDFMFSEAPYTEAVLMSLLGSLDTLDDNGYMCKFKDKKTAIDIFSQNGYDTFFANYYPSIYPKYMYYGAKEVCYIENFHLMHLWEYRFSYFKDLYLKCELTNEEIKMLVDMLEDNLLEWMKLLLLLKKESKQTRMINDCISREDLFLEIESLEKEINIFSKDKEGYLKSFLEEGEKHRLFEINKLDYVDKIHDEEFKDWFIKEYLTLFKKIGYLQKRRNMKNAKLPIKKILNNIRKKDVVKGILAGYKNLLFDKDIMARVTKNFDMFKAQRSFRVVSQTLYDWIDNRKENSKPWMAYVHVDDAHYPENFFTYDTNDKNIIKEEFFKINSFLDHLPKDYCGTITSDLSLLYCDSIIENIFKYLEKKDLLKNTSVVITADHGFSYYFNPIREKYVISSYRENYNVPFLIYDCDIKPRMISGYLSTKDIPATLLDLSSISLPNSFKGKSLLSFEGREYASLEYMGGGCPDLKRRPILLGYRNDKYDVIAEFVQDKILIKEVYDMKKDRFQNTNIAKNKKVNISKEVEWIKNRYDEIMENIEK